MQIGYHKRELLVKLLKTAIFFVVGLLFLIPLFWMLSSSLKTPSEVFARDFKWLPANPVWANYTRVWTDEKVNMANGFMNSAIITVSGIVVALVFSSLAAYAFAKVDFKGKNFVFMLFLSTMMLPMEVTIIPRFMIFHKIKLYNNLMSVILPHWFAPSAIFMLRQFYMGLPTDLMEAAKIDGAGHPRIFSQVMMPLTKTALVSQCVLLFVSTWNEYMAPLIFLANQKLYTAALVVKYQVFEEGSSTSQLMAASSSAIIPTVIIFMFCQRYFVEGIATSGVKG
jgi:multiple sugar transport system permease protein